MKTFIILLVCLVQSLFGYSKYPYSMHGTETEFIFIQEMSPRIIHYKSMVKDVNDFTWSVDKSMVLKCSSEKALMVVAKGWLTDSETYIGPFNLTFFNTLSKHWNPTVKQQVENTEPNLLRIPPIIGIEEPNKIEEPNIVDETQFLVYVTITGTKYHNLFCRYLSITPISMNIIEALKKNYTACSFCKPIFYSDK